MSKIWFVTGAARGIGAEIVKAALAAGEKVVATGRDPAKVAQAFDASSEKLFVTTLDVAVAGQAESAVAAAIARFGGIDVLVNNAGYGQLGAFEQQEAADAERQFAINVFGVFNVTRAFLDQLRATKGRIVNIGSIQSFVHVSWPNSAAYTTSKHGVLGFTRALAAELGKDGVRVNAIGPGLIETKINAEARTKNPDMVANVMRHTPLNRPGKPADIAGPAVFLASDMSAYVTGCIIMADGGFRTI